MSPLDRRLQVLIDGAFPDDAPSRREAGRLLLDAPPLLVADWTDLKHEVEGRYADPSTSA